MQLETTRMIQSRQKWRGLLRAAVTQPAAATWEHLAMGMTGAIISCHHVLCIFDYLEINILTCKEKDMFNRTLLISEASYMGRLLYR